MLRNHNRGAPPARDRSPARRHARRRAQRYRRPARARGRDGGHAAQGRVHSRTVAAVAIDWPMGSPSTGARAIRVRTRTHGGVGGAEPRVRRSQAAWRTVRRRDPVAAHGAGPRVHRPAVPQRVRTGAAAGGGRGVFLPQGPVLQRAVVGTDGADHAAVRRCDQALRRTRRHRHRVVPSGRTQGRPHTRVPAPLDRGRGRPLHR